MRFLIVLAIACVAPVAAAQDAPAETPSEGEPAASPEDAQATQEARRRYESGTEHFQARRFREAIRDFSLAAQIVRSADLWFNIARAHEELSEYQAAIDHFQRYLRDRVDPPDRERVEQRIRSLEERLEESRRDRRSAPTTGTLRVRANVEGAEVEVDGRDIGSTPIDLPLTLEPGRHRVSFQQAGYIPFHSEVNIQAGVTSAAYADLQPATEYRAVRGSRIFTWIVGGLSVVGAGLSVERGIVAQSRLDNDRAGALQAGRSSDYLLGAAIVLAIGAIALYFIEGRAVATERVSAVDEVE